MASLHNSLWPVWMPSLVFVSLEEQIIQVKIKITWRYLDIFKAPPEYESKTSREYIFSIQAYKWTQWYIRHKMTHPCVLNNSSMNNVFLMYYWVVLLMYSLYWSTLVCTLLIIYSLDCTSCTLVLLYVLYLYFVLLVVLSWTVLCTSSCNNIVFYLTVQHYHILILYLDGKEDINAIVLI